MKITPTLVDDEYVYVLPPGVAHVFVDGFSPGMSMGRQCSKVYVNKATSGAASWRFRFSSNGTMVTLVPPLRFRRRKHAEHVTVETPPGVYLHTDF